MHTPSIQGYVAKRLGDRRVEEHISARERAREVAAGLLAKEDRIRQLLFEPRLCGSFADHNHVMFQASLREGVNCVSEDVEPLLHHNSAKEGDDHFVVGDSD